MKLILEICSDIQVQHVPAGSAIILFMIEDKFVI